MIICIYLFKDFIHITILINNIKLTVLTNPDFCAVYLDLTADNPSESASYFSEYFGPVFQTPINILPSNSCKLSFNIIYTYYT